MNRFMIAPDTMSTIRRLDNHWCFHTVWAKSGHPAHHFQVKATSRNKLLSVDSVEKVGYPKLPDH